MRELLKSASLRLLLAASLGTLTSCAVIRPPQGSAAVVTETLPTSGQRQDALERVRKIDQAMPAAVVTFNEIVTAALVDRQRLGYYSNRQHANLERAFLRIKRQATQLKSIDQRYAPWRSRARHGQEAASLEEIEAAIVAIYADRLAFVAEGSMLVSMQADPSLITKFNEALLKAGEPKGVFDRMFHEFTDVDAWRVRVKQNRGFSKMTSAGVSGQFITAWDRAHELHSSGRKLRKSVMKRSYAVLPELSNELHHTLLASWLRSNRTDIADRLRSARDMLFTEVAEIPYPGEALTEFSASQKRRLHRMLQPGDILLTYTGGYMSNLFLPGAFKHAITYVGNNGQRQKAGLTPSKIGYIEGIEFKHLRERLKIESISGNYGTMPADVIEAVAEGVIFNSLDHLLDTHVTRVVAFRPRLTTDERRGFLLRVFSLLGTDYDFAFDFSDASSHCCTEVIYRTLNQTGPIAFTLARRGGYYNMSGDDIVAGHYARLGSFEVVFLAVPESKNGKNRKARILKGHEAEQELRLLVPPKS